MWYKVRVRGRLKTGLDALEDILCKTIPERSVPDGLKDKCTGIFREPVESFFLGSSGNDHE